MKTETYFVTATDRSTTFLQVVDSFDRKFEPGDKLKLVYPDGRMYIYELTSASELESGVNLVEV